MLKIVQKLTINMNTFFTWKSQPWYLRLGFQGEEPVDLKIACPDQSAVPGYSTVPLPVTTVTATVTRTVAVTIKSEGSDLGFASDTGDEKSSGDTILKFLVFSCQDFLLCNFKTLFYFYSL